jgi:hypothetical protein
MPYKLTAAIVALTIVTATPAPAAGAPQRQRTSDIESVDAWVVANDALHRIGAWLVAVEHWRAEQWRLAYWHNVEAAIAANTATQETQARARPAETTTPRSTPRTSGSCGAVPAYISWRESRCTYTVRNPSGAGGAYQLMPGTANAMAARIGHPELIGTNASEWPPALQDAAAAALWDGGRGACNWDPPNYCG